MEGARKWISFVLSIWIMAVSATNFDFSIYSSRLKDVLNIDQMKLNNLAVASDLGKLLGWVSGFACLKLPTWKVLTIAAVLGFIGYGLQWLVVTSLIPAVPYALYFVLCMVAGNSICWLNTVCFRVAISNFPSLRGIAVGLNTSYSGLSTVIYTMIASIVNPQSQVFYLLLNAMVPLFFCVMTAPVINIPHEAPVLDKQDRTMMYAATAMAIITAIYSVAYNFLPKGSQSVHVVFITLLVIMLTSLVFLPVWKAILHRRRRRDDTMIKSSKVMASSSPSHVKRGHSLEAQCSSFEARSLTHQWIDGSPSLTSFPVVMPEPNSMQKPLVEPESKSMGSKSMHHPKLEPKSKCLTITPNDDHPTSSQIHVQMASCTTANKEEADQVFNWKSYVEAINKIDLLYRNLRSHQFLNCHLQFQGQPLEAKPPPTTEAEKFDHAKARYPSVGKEYSVRELLRSTDFWLYYFTYLCGATVSLVFINNFGQIIQSLGYTKTPVLLSLLSSAGFLGRLASGLPDYSERMYKGIARSAWLVIWTIPMVPTLLVVAYAGADEKMGLLVIYCSAAIMGWCSGAVTSVAVPLTSELFGTANFAVNHNILISNIALGSLVFGNFAGFVYDRAAAIVSAPAPAPAPAHECFGSACFRNTLLAWSVLGFVACILGGLLWLRTRALYKSSTSTST